MNKLICIKCSKTFSTKQRLEYHINKKVCENKVIKCEKCTSTFSSKYTLEHHINNYCKNNINDNKNFDNNNVEKICYTENNNNNCCNDDIKKELSELRELILNIEKEKIF